MKSIAYSLVTVLATCALSAVAAVEPVADIPVLPDESAPSDVFATADKAQAKVWSFVGGKLPAGCKAHPLADVGAEGLRSTDVTNGKQSAGVWVKEAVTPAGAFVFVADFLAGEVSGRQEGILWDTMAVTYPAKATNRGFQIAVGVADDKWTPVFYGGDGAKTASCRGPTAKLAPGKRAKLRVYFGANGQVVWDFAGQAKTCELGFDGPLAPQGKTRTTIGDRSTSIYHAFAGTVRTVAIAPAKVPEFTARLRGRTAFRRDEREASVTVEIANKTETPVAEAKALVEQFVAAGRVRAADIDLGTLAAKERRAFAAAVEPRVTPGWHPLRVTVTGKTPAGELKRSFVLKLGVGPVFADRMTALMWGFGGRTADLADLGFTHGLSYTWKIGPNLSKVDPEPTCRQLDAALVDGIGLTRSSRVRLPNEDAAGAEKDRERYLRKTRENERITHGKKKREAVEVSQPELRDYIRRLAADDAQAFAAYPAFAGMLPCSENRDGTGPSFNTEHLRYRQETGRDVPEEVVGKRLPAKMLEEMQAKYPDGIVPEDDPILAYYRWFWSGGDGWPSYTGAFGDVYHRYVKRPDFFVFWDPAVRCPPRWGSGGNVDMLNQWVYANPEPMNVAGPCEEMFAMAAGRPGQKVSIMTQLICYRERVAPAKKKVSPEPEWVRRRPEASFPTIAPDSLQEAVWSMIAKPVQAIMFHGWGTIHETGAATGYTYTNPESRERIRRLLKDVVAPLGPTLLRLGRTPQPVAVLESFTTAVFGGPASFGWTVPAITYLQRARFDPRVVYEETVMRDGLGGVKVLYLPQCHFLPADVCAKVREFQKNGGLVLADDDCLKEILPDVRVPVVSFAPVPESDHSEDINAMEAAKEGDAKTRAATMRAKAKMVAQAEELRRQLAGRYAPAADSSSPEIVTYSRTDGAADYLFAVNDRRTFGDYFGPWGLTMEKGLPTEGWVSAPDTGVKAVYELSRGGKVAFSRKGGKIVVPVRYETNDGRLFAFLKDEITSLRVEASASSGAVHVKLTVVGASGRPVRALLPVEVRLADAAGKELDGAGYLVAQDGVCEADVLTNADDAPGAYTLVCRDRASGLSVTRKVR